jgi:hypothetical protein
MHVPNYSAYPLFCPIALLKVLIYTCKLRAFALLLYMRGQSEQLLITLSSYLAPNFFFDKNYYG